MGQCSAFELFEKQTSKDIIARSSFIMPRASVHLPVAELPQELSEPITGSKNILFPIKYQSPLTKIASALEFKLPENFDAKADKKDSSEMLFKPKEDGDFLFRLGPLRAGATDFAQKYLFKAATT